DMSSDKPNKPDSAKKDAGGQQNPLPEKIAEPLAINTRPKVICEAKPPTTISEGSIVALYAKPTVGKPEDYVYKWTINDGNQANSLSVDGKTPWIAHWDTTGVRPGNFKATVSMYDKLSSPASAAEETQFDQRGLPTESPKPLDECDINIAVMARPFKSGDRVSVSLQRAQASVTSDLALWVVIQ